MCQVQILRQPKYQLCYVKTTNNPYHAAGYNLYIDSD